jgi:hypothetical protein
MKLYATVKSERASKGQGGNEFIKIELAGGSATNSQHLTTIWLKVEGDNAVLLVPNQSGDMVKMKFPVFTKGEKQKGC